MMTSKDVGRSKRSDETSKEKLLNEIEGISKALSLDKNPSKSSFSAARSMPKSVDKTNSTNVISKPGRLGSDGPSTKEKKSFWNWKPLKALSQVRNRRFNCCFTLDVHTIEGLGSKFNDLSFRVHWKRRDGAVVTNPTKVIEGVVEFGEKLTHTCSVYGSRSGPHSSAKYEAKNFLLYVAVHGDPKLDLGKHRIDLTRLLPRMLEELEHEKRSGTWTTSFKLLGEAKGATLNVSFGYLVLGDGISPNNRSVLQLLDSKSMSRQYVKSNQDDGKGLMRRAGSLPANLKSSTSYHSTENVKVLHEVPPKRVSELSSAVKTLYQMLDQEKSDSLVEDQCEIEVPTDAGKPGNSSHRSSSNSFQENKCEIDVPVDDGKPVESSHCSSLDPFEETKCEIEVPTDDGKPVESSHRLPSDSFQEIKCEVPVVDSKHVESSYCSSSDSRQENMVNDEHSEFPVVEKRVESLEDKSSFVDDRLPSDSFQENKCEVPGVDSKHVESSYSSPSDSSQENMVNDDNSEFSVVEKRVESLDEKSSFVDDRLPSDSFQENKYEVPGVDSKYLESSYCSTSDSGWENMVNNENSEISVVEKRVESLEEKSSFVEDTEKVVDDKDVISSDLPVVCFDAGVSCQEEVDFKKDEIAIDDCNSADKNMCTKESLLEDLDSVLNNVTELEKEAIDTPQDKSESSDQEKQNEDKPNMMTPSVGMDDLADTVADEFLSMLETEDTSFDYYSEEELDSPRERLLREFEKEAVASGCSLFGFDINEEDMEDYDYYAPSASGWEDFSEDFDFIADDQSEYPKIRAKVMEDMETQELMQEWGLDEMAFQSSPPNSRGGFGSPIDLPSEDHLHLPSLGEGLGPFVQTESGGFVRSMNPNLFTNAKSGGSLIMQISRPVVVPAELGSGVMDVLQHLASVGLERLSMQANKLMPLEDITGSTMQQLAWEAAPRVEASKSHNLLQDESEGGRVISAGKKGVKEASSGRKSKKTGLSLSPDEVDSEFGSLEDLAPLAMDKIEALSIEGLKIQSGMADEEAPSDINTTEGKRKTSARFMGLEGAAGLQLLNLMHNEVDVDDGLMGLSLTLDEWMKLDSGEIDEEEWHSERTSKLLAAHHAKSSDLNFLGKKGEKKQGKGGRKGGLLGNNFTVALMVQLRDPLRDYEPVGTPMLALIQVERVFIPPKPKIYCRVSEAIENSDEDDLESNDKEEKRREPKEEKPQEQELVPQYKISEVHVTGLKNEPGKKKWGSAAQQQSGSRWLLANGMGKGNKNPIIKPRIATKSPLPSTVISQPGDTLWSISAKFHGSGAKWKQLASLNPHIRNPNVILPNETIKLR